MARWVAGWVALVVPILVLVAGFSLLGPRAMGTSWVPITIEQLAAQAQGVVLGVVRSVEVSRDAAGRVFTRIELEARDWWKGSDRTARCSIVAGGGTLGEATVAPSGQVDYAIGDEVVVFLARNDAGEWVTLGLEQGQFRVQTNARTGRRWVANRFWGRPGSEDDPGLPLFPANRPISLDELRRRTREAIE